MKTALSNHQNFSDRETSVQQWTKCREKTIDKDKGANDELKGFDKH